MAHDMAHNISASTETLAYVNAQCRWSGVPENDAMKESRRHYQAFLLTRRIFIGMSFCAYVSSLIEAVTRLGNSFSGIAVFLLLTLFLTMELVAECTAGLFSLTGLAAEMVARSLFWRIGETHDVMSGLKRMEKYCKRSPMGASLRYPMSRNRDGVVFLHDSASGNGAKNSETFMLMTHVVISPRAETLPGLLLSRIRPDLASRFSVSVPGGIVHNFSTTSLGTVLSPVTYMEFSINDTSMLPALMRFMKAALNPFSSMVRIDTLIDSLMSGGAIREQGGMTRISRRGLLVHCEHETNVPDMGSIVLMGDDFVTEYRVDRYLGITEPVTAPSH